jgi:EAL domain-containing protein (putative c-di-GMP-specific phosphodiesterase class I)
MLDRSSADPGLLTLEVSESYLDRDRDRDRVLIVLDELKELGVKLALDDFGAGHSSLSHLATIPIDEIKIDRSFIVDLGADPSSQVVVTAILQLAHGLGMTVVSEGVETAGQRRELIRLGCDFCQGSYFAQPMPASALDALIRKQAGESTPHLPSRTRVAKRGPAATDPSRSKQGDDSAAGPERPGLRT